MKTSKAGRRGRCAIVAATLVVLVAGQASSQTEVAFAPTMSHVNQKLPELLTLEAALFLPNFCDDNLQFKRASLSRTYPDGVVLPFAVPPGKFLVVTDVAVEMNPDPDAGEEIPLAISLRNPQTGFLGRVLLSSVTVPPEGIIVGEVHLETGFTVGGAAEICVQAINAQPLNIQLHGYLMRFP